MSLASAPSRTRTAGRSCVSLWRSIALRRNGRLPGKRRTRSRKRGRAVGRLAGIDKRGRPADAVANGCGASLLELPPVTTLTLVRDDVADALVARRGARRASNRHDEAVVALEALWLNVRGDAALALRQRLALSWSEMYARRPRRAGRAARARRRASLSRRASTPPTAPTCSSAAAASPSSAATSPKRSRASRGALELNEQLRARGRSLAANAHEWRSRCYQFRRDWDAAGSDAERALEIATARSATSRRRHTRSSRRRSSPSASATGSSRA